MYPRDYLAACAVLTVWSWTAAATVAGVTYAIVRLVDRHRL